jgi:hypothetical protein
MLGLLDLFFGSRPAQHRLDLSDYMLGDTGGFGNMWLFGKILGEQLPCRIDRSIMVMVYRTNYELRAINLLQIPADPLGANNLMRCHYIQ